MRLASISRYTLTAVVLLGQAASAQTELVDRAVAAWANVKTVRATFEQTIMNPLTERTLISRGEYQQRRPDKLSVVFVDPAQDRIVADGRNVWLYLASSTPDQVIKTAQGASGTGTVDLSAQFLTAPHTRFNITPVGTLVVNDRPCHGFNFIPKSEANAPFKMASVWIDDEDATIRQFEVTDATGLQRRIRLLTFKTNGLVDERSFTFTVPKGVRVVER